jgi:tetratricopeptide (TPR) repeat protein
MKPIVFFITLFCFSSSFAQSEVDEKMYNTYLGQQSTIQVWKDSVKERQIESEKNPNDKNATYKLLLAQFGLLSSTMKDMDEDLFDEYYDPTLNTIKKLIGFDKKWAEPYALQSAVYGFKMGYSPMQGMFLGSKSSSLTEKAIQLNPSSALAWKVYANSKYFTPEMWGGDLEEAITAYEKCIALYEAAPEQLSYNWFYLDALAFQGQAYLKKGEQAKAISTFEKALKVEPEFAWVKYALLPKARAKK